MTMPWKPGRPIRPALRLAGIAGTLFACAAIAAEPGWWTQQKQQCGLSPSLAYINWLNQGSPCGNSQPYRDPRIDQARALNEEGRAAFGAGDYDKAVDLFQRAYAAYPDAAYRNNMTLALARGHFDKGRAYFQQRRYDLAIAEYERANSLDPSDAAVDNIHIARSNLAIDASNNAWHAKNYDLAVMYLQEANRWKPNPSLASDIARIRRSEASSRASAAYDAHDWANAEALFARLRGLDPTSEWASRMWANSITHQAIDLADKHPSLELLLAAFTRSIDAYSIAAQANGANEHLTTSIRWARSNARALLSRAAVTNADWERVIAAHRQWAEAAPNDQAAREELASIQTRHASREGRSATAEAITRADAAASEATSVDPNSAEARDVRDWATGQKERLRTAQAITRTLTAPRASGAGPARQQLDDAHATAHADPSSPCPWDSARGCAHAAAPATAVSAPDAAFQLAPVAANETPAQTRLRSEVAARQGQVTALQQKLAAATDPFERSTIKGQVLKQETALRQVQDQAVEAGVAHRIERRAPPVPAGP